MISEPCKVTDNVGKVYSLVKRDMRESRHPLVVFNKKDAEKITNRVLNCWIELRHDLGGEELTKRELRLELRKRVFDSLNKDVGFSIWIPIAIWIAKIVIEVLIKRWFERHLNS